MKRTTVFKKVLKTFIWMVLITVILFVLAAGLIQVPAIQTRIVHYATSLISSKTHTRVEIGNVSISFPKSIVIEGLYLEDLNQDTLIYAGSAKVNMALYDLFQNKIAISSFNLEEATIKLHSTLTDPLFNYNFLLTAFSDTTTPVKTDTLNASNWTFSLDQVALTNVRFSYNDDYTGMNVSAVLGNAEAVVDEINPAKAVYQLDELLVDGLTAKVLMIKSGNTPVSNPQNISPKVGAKNLQLQGATIQFTDSVGNLSVRSVIDACELEGASIDLEKQVLISEYLHLSKSHIRYHDFSPENPVDSNRPVSKTNWKVTAKRINLEDDFLIYQVGNKPVIQGIFNPAYWEYSDLSLEASNFQYSADLTKVVISKFHAIDQNQFEIASLETDFTMDEHAITAKNLKLSTQNSDIDADFNIQYSSLSSLIDSMQFSNLNLDLRNLHFKNSDLLYFNPELVAQPFFQNGANETTASGKIEGPMNNLSANELTIKTGANTLLKTDFRIQGLPAYQTAFYDFSNLSLISGKKDLVMLAGSYLPGNIEIPENFNVLLAFKGVIKSFESTASVVSSFGDANVIASIDSLENFKTKISLSSLDLGRFLKDTLMYGPVSLNAEAVGKGLELKTIQATIKADVSEIFLNKYKYHQLTMDGDFSGMQFEGKIKLNDENAVFDFDGLVNLNPNQEQYKFKLNVLGADLQKLGFTKEDARISFVAAADMKGGSVNQMNGTAGITNIVVAKDGKKYVLDSFLTASVNEPNKSEIKVISALIDIKYSGTASPVAIPSLLREFINNYFPVSDLNSPPIKSNPSKFNFEIQLHNHPILSKVLFPALKEFEPGIIQGSFDSEKNDLKLNATLRKMVYGSTEIKDFALLVKTDQKALDYQITCRGISNSQVNLDNFSFDGTLADQKMLANLSSTDGKKKKLQIRSLITRENGNYKLALDPKEFYLVNKQWDISPDNFIEFGDQGFRIHNFLIKLQDSQIHVASVHDQFNDDLKVDIQNFKLDDLSKIVEKDTSLVQGNVDGNILLKRVADSYGLIADVKVSKLIVHEVPIGNLSVKAANPRADKFDVDVVLDGPDNQLTMNGFYIPNGGANSINLKTKIQSLSMKTLEAFSLGQISEAAGTLSGNILMDGRSDAPDISGELVFNNAFLKPSFLNNRLEMKHETIELKKDGIYFKNFTFRDAGQHTAIIDGAVMMKEFTDFVFALQVNTKDFLIFNTTAKNNKEFFGRMVIDSKINVQGPMSLPVVNARVKLKKGSNFTFSVPEDQLTTDKGEDVVEFDNSRKFNPILNRGDKKGGHTNGISGFELSSIIEIDKEATLRLLMDPASTDSLVVKGEAALSFTIDQSGQMSLTGAYNLNNGSYLVSLESVIKKRFEIDAGSTIIWNGDPLDAEISINATYSVRASPYDLVADQISGLSDADKGGYKQRYPFLVLLKLRGEILHPVIHFEIQLPPEDKGILGGAVNQKLNLLNADESALNKQVFALLVLGRFVQENPFQTESSGTSALIRTTVGKFLSAQLNQMSSKVIPGMELNFDIQSYDDYQSGQAQGRTQVEIGVKKQLFDERFSVQLGGTVDVEGEEVKQNSANDITSDITLEYKLTKDGRFRMKGFRHNQYEGAIEGQLIETGIGLVYVKDFNRWKWLFKTYKRKELPVETPEEGK